MPHVVTDETVYFVQQCFMRGISSLPSLNLGVFVLTLLLIVWWLQATLQWMHPATAVQLCCRWPRKQTLLSLWWPSAQEVACTRLQQCLSVLPKSEKAGEKGMLGVVHAVGVAVMLTTFRWDGIPCVCTVHNHSTLDLLGKPCWFVRTYPK